MLLLKVLQRAMYRAVMTIMSILGFVSSPFFYVFYMLDFFARRDGRLVMQAILLGGPNLLRSFTLGLIVIVCFGFYTYAYFSQSVIVAQELCHSPFQCVSKHILDSLTGDLTTVLGDDFGNFAYPATVFWADSWNSFKSAFVVVSIIFWVFLLQGIIQGQIIDAFAEMRNASNAASEDLEQKCFVSSIDRFVFNSFPGEWDKRGGGQYAWSYLLFMTYLLDKDQDEFNGLEGFVYRCFQRDDISFIPIEKFIARQQQEMQNKTEENLAVLQRVSVRVDQVGDPSINTQPKYYSIRSEKSTLDPHSKVSKPQTSELPNPQTLKPSNPKPSNPKPEIRRSVNTCLRSRILPKRSSLPLSTAG